MSLEANKAIVRRAIEAINKQDLSLLDDLVASDYFDHITKQGLDSTKQSLTMVYKGVPDYQGVINDIIAEGDKVWAHITYSGTHTGEYRGFAPSGKKISYKSVTIKRVVNGKIVEGWTVNDMMDAFKQLGVIKYTEQGKQLLPPE